MKRFALLLLSVVAVGCAATQQPVRFHAPAAATQVQPIDNVVQALAQNGHTADKVDRQANVVHTQWQDTGFMYGQVGNATATIVRRYIVTVSMPADNNLSAGADILLRADTKRCVQGTFSSDNQALPANCEQMDGLVPKHQKELDSVGAQLRASLGAPPAPAPATK